MNTNVTLHDSVIIIFSKAVSLLAGLTILFLQKNRPFSQSNLTLAYSVSFVNNRGKKQQNNRELLMNNTSLLENNSVLLENNRSLLENKGVLLGNNTSLLMNNSEKCEKIMNFVLRGADIHIQSPQ